MFLRALTKRFSRIGKPVSPRRIIPALTKLEDRLTPAAVHLYPGSERQTDNPYTDKSLSIIHGGLFTVGMDIHGQPIDFNKDGVPDLLTLPNELITGGPEPLIASIQGMPLLSNGNSGLFTQTKVYSSSTNFSPYTQPSSSGLAVLDWNLDLAQDFISLKSNNTGVVDYTLYENDGFGVFRPVKTQQLFQASPQYFSFNQVCLSDFNEDGAPDIVVPTSLNRGEFTIYQGELVSGKWTGLFNLATANAIQVGTITGPRENDSSGIQPIATDLNGDGKVDITVKGADSNVNLFINDGSGKFSLAPNLVLATVNNRLAWNIISGDLNHDGKNDLVISTNSRAMAIGATLTGPMTVYLNETPGPTSGNPVFGTGYGVGGSSLAYGRMALGDMNLDGHLDLVASQQAYDGILFNVLENDGTGQFLRNQQFVGYKKDNNTQSGIALADWNLDGQLDVALVSGWDLSVPVSNDQLTQSIGVSINATFTAPGVKPATLPPATVGLPFSFQLTPTGGDSTLPYAVSVDPNNNPLPPGLLVSPSGLISGTPTQSGPFQVQFRVSQSNGLRGTTLSYLQVTNAQPGVVVISPATLPDGKAGVAYSQLLTATGGTGAVNFALSAGTLPAGLTLSFNGLISGTPTTTGPSSFTVSATDSVGNVGYAQYGITIGTNPTPPLAGPFIAAGSGQGGLVSIFNANGTPRLTFAPYGTGYQGAINVAQGDVNGDGVADLVTGTGAGVAPHVLVLDGNTLAVISSFYAYAEQFLGGVRVAAGDVDGNGKAEVVTGTGPGSAPNVCVFNGTTGATQQSFYAYAPEYLGGINVAAGDVTGDGKADIITGSGVGVSPHVVVFDSATAQAIYSFYAYLPQFKGGVNVGAGDVDGDGKADILTGAGPGGDPHVKVFSGADGTQKQSFDAFAVDFNGGVSVASADLNQDGKADIIAGTQTQSAQVKAFNATDLSVLDDFFAFQGGVGVWVAGK